MTNANVIRQRIESLRQQMQQTAIAACLILSSDPHLSEYPPEHWEIRRWLSGFTGSAGTLIITHDFAGLWTDSRYWTQAEKELAHTGITLIKMQTSGLSECFDWLRHHLTRGQTIAVDADTLSLAQAQQLKKMTQATGLLLDTTTDLINRVYADRPALPNAPVFEHTFSASRQEKLVHIRKIMQEHGAQWHFVSMLDDIAWILNLRGADVSFNPVFISHLLIGPDQINLFIDPNKVSTSLQHALAQDGITVRPYAHAKTALQHLPAQSTILIDPRRLAWGWQTAIPTTVKQREAINPSTLAKAQKTPSDIAHIRSTMEQDGAALCEFFAWFEANINRHPMTELDIDTQLTAARALRPGFISLSFDTIAAFNANAALPHYRATPESHANIEGDGLLLIDSGGQYVTGTTDITRVTAVGTPSLAQKQDFTRVMKGLIQLSSTPFPRGTLSPMLDALARGPLWKEYMDYGHGTGHGVGYFLNVHEGPQSLSRTQPDPTMAMLEGMVTSIEPGVYRPGKWGIRHENLVVNVPAQTNEFGDFLRFETLTLCPFDTRCLLPDLLTETEITWINEYHHHVRARLLPLVENEARLWLQQRTEAL